MAHLPINLKNENLTYLISDRNKKYINNVTVQIP